MPRLTNIVVPLDFSPVSDAALTRAIALGKACDATLHLVHAILPFDLSGFRHEFSTSLEQSDWARIHARAKADLEAAAGKVKAEGVPVTQTLVEDSPVEAIEAAYQAKEGDMIVMGTHGFSGIKHMVLGSIAEKTLRTIHAPVFCVRGSESAQTEPIRRILVATDFSDPAAQAADFGVGLAKDLSASVELVHAVYSPNTAVAPYGVPLSAEYLLAVRNAARLQIEELRDNLQREGVTIDVFVHDGDATNVLCERAKTSQADLIVMGTHGYTGLKHVLFGSVAERVVRTAPCSVLTVNP
jgi:nucleotide-binding universal stress UspA family protein